MRIGPLVVSFLRRLVPRVGTVSVRPLDLRWGPGVHRPYGVPVYLYRGRGVLSSLSFCRGVTVYISDGIDPVYLSGDWQTFVSAGLRRRNFLLSTSLAGRFPYLERRSSLSGRGGSLPPCLYFGPKMGLNRFVSGKTFFFFFSFFLFFRCFVKGLYLSRDPGVLLSVVCSTRAEPGSEARRTTPTVQPRPSTGKECERR